jgi:hypothetical protein
MRRDELEHLLRAAGAIADEDTLIVIGSQAILGTYPDAPADVLKSIEADLIPTRHPERWNLIDGVIGEGSPFHETFGYYADGVEETTAKLPEGWKERLVAICNDNTRGVRGLCVEVHDLLLSKYYAGRPKDLVFTRALAAAGLANRTTLIERLAVTEMADDMRAIIAARIERDFAGEETGGAQTGPNE